MSIRDVRGSSKDQRWIQDVYGEYLDSLADLNTGLFSVIGTEENARQDEIFAAWFANDQAHPLVILQGSDQVGFALVTRLRSAPGAQSATYRMSEFFVRRPHRHAGIGRNAATLIFDRFSGNWEILEYQRHPGSIAFWRRVLAVYCPGNFSERSQNGEVHQRFKSRSSASR